MHTLSLDVPPNIRYYYKLCSHIKAEFLPRVRSHYYFIYEHNKIIIGI